jgi:uncharacterized protein
MNTKRSDQIQFGKFFALPLQDLASQGNAILGIRDSGKTYTATLLAERLLDYGVPFVVFDPIGVWRNLKVPHSPDSKGYNVVVAGEGADLELTPASAPSIVRAAMRENISLVLDLYSINLSKRDWKSIVESCVRLLLYENKPHGLRHIFLEEAAEFVPQRIGPDQGSVYAEIEKLARMGGNASLGYTLINQRADELNKAVLELCDCLFLHRQKGRNSLLALGKWLDVADTANRKDVIRSLPALEQGKCWIWSQGSLKPILVQIPLKRSFHPDRRNPTVAASRMAADVSGFVQRLEHALALQAKPSSSSSCPKTSRSKGAPEASPAILSQLEVQLALATTRHAALETQVKTLTKQALQYRTLLQRLVSLGQECAQSLDDTPIPVQSAPPGEQPAKVLRPRKDSIGSGPSSSRNLANGTLPKAQRRIVAVLGRHHPDARPKSAVAIEAGYAASGGGFNNALSGLRSMGIVQGSDLLKLTQNGLDVVADADRESLPGGSALARYWMSQLPKAEAAILEVLTTPPRRAWAKTDLAIQAGYEPTGGGFNNALSRLRSLLLVQGRGELVASDRLFDH